MNNSYLARLFFAVSLTATLAACGGGGSDSTSTAAPALAPAPAPAPAAATREPITSVPVPTYTPISFQADAFAHLNAVRSALGLGLLTQDARIDAAAAAHVAYVQRNGGDHYESATLPGYTGYSPGDRLAAAGYSASWWAEDMAYSGTGTASVDTLLAAVYHRIPLLSYKLTSIGIGFMQTHVDTDPRFNAYLNVLDFGYVGSGQGAPALKSVVWPADNATATSVAMPAESPRPGVTTHGNFEPLAHPI